jgi:hypothetical protein
MNPSQDPGDQRCSMPESTDTPTTVPPRVAAALAELKERLHQPETVRIALKQYVVGEIVKTLLAADAAGSLSLKGVTTVNDEDDAGGTSCVEETYEVFGLQVYSHTVCASSTVSDQLTVTL